MSRKARDGYTQNVQNQVLHVLHVEPMGAGQVDNIYWRFRVGW